MRSLLDLLSVRPFLTLLWMLEGPLGRLHLADSGAAG